MTSAAADEATIAAAMAGLHEIVLPVPFGPDGVTCWLVEDDPLTLVDAGANWCTSIFALERSLAERGHRLEDLERLVITHHHNDHAGGLEAIVARSGAELVAPASSAPWLADQRRQQKLDDTYRVDQIERHGAPAALCAALRSANAVDRSWGCSVEVTRPLADGDELVFAGRTWTALARPGHSYADTVFLDARRGIAVVGDHLLPAYPSVPYMALPPDPHDRDALPPQLRVYRDSIAKTRELEVDLILAGHGAAFRGHRELIDLRERSLETLLGRILSALASGPATAYALALALWERGTLIRPEAMMSTVLGHLAILLEAGAVVAGSEEDVSQFALS